MRGFRGGIVIGLIAALTIAGSVGRPAAPPGLAADEWNGIRRAIQATYVHETQVFGQEAFAGQPLEWFGRSVAASADTVVVGSPRRTVAGQAGAGAAFVFVRAGSMWVQQQVLFSPEASANDEFGASVAIDGDTIVVGAAHADLPGAGDAGTAYVFVRSGTSWLQQQRLSAPDAASLDFFGGSVSISGDTVVVGADADDTAAAQDAGSAYVFVRSGTTWSAQQKLTASDGAADDHLGFSVSISLDTIIAGAYADDTAAGVNAGSAYVFLRTGSSWSEQAKLVASDGAESDLFGAAVSVSGDAAVVGAIWDDNAGGSDAGAAYVFARVGPAWVQQQKLLGSEVTEQDFFGTSVSISDDMIAIGARSHDTPTAARAGAVYGYLRVAGTWTEQQKLVAPDGADDDRFGQSVAVSGVTLVAGAPVHDVSSNSEEGAAYAFVRSGGTWGLQQILLARESDSSPDGFGYAVTLSGNTLLVGAFQDGGSNSGAAYVFVRDVTSWTLQQKLFAPGVPAGEAFGISVTLAGDTAVVGAWLADTAAGTDAGAAYVFVRAGTAWSFQQKLTAPDGATHDHFGTSVALSDDTVVVGAPGHATTNGSDAGSAYVFVRSGTTWTQQQRLDAADGASFDEFGISVAVDQDTAVVGAVWHDTPMGTDSGTVYVFARSGTTWTEQQHFVPPNAAPADAFGASVSLEADTIVAGSPRHATGGASNRGAAYVWVRAGTSWSLQQELLAADGNAQDQFGVGVSVSAGTAVVGAPYDSDPGPLSQAGSAYVFERSGTTWTEAQKLVAPVAAVQARFGNSVAVDGDTVVIGADGDVTPSGASAGSAHVFRMYPVDADVAVSITGNPNPVRPGGDIVYTIVVTNGGPGPAFGVEVMLPTPAGLVFLSTSGACTTSFPCFLGTLASGDTRTIDARYRVPSGYGGPNPIVATVAATATGADPNQANNTATAEVLVGPAAADLALTMLGPATAGPGDVLAYSLTVTHNGLSDAVSVEVSNVPPVGLVFVSNTGDCTTPFPCLLGTVPAGASRIIVSTFEVPGGYAGPNPIVHDAVVTSATFDPDPANNFDSVSTTFIPPELQAHAIAVDAAGNGVLQPNETVLVGPTWRNVGPAPVANVAGAAMGFSGPLPATYTISDPTATYGTIAPGGTASCGADCYAMGIAATARPATHWDSSFVEQVTPGGAQRVWQLHVGDSFTDVLDSSGFYRFVEILLHNGVTAGCSATDYCPTSATAREQMAVFVLVAREGGGYAPPACGTPLFSDVPASSPYCRWIEELARRGVVSGCGGTNYCPGNAVTREQMAVFALRTLDPQLDPPACTAPVFADVPASSPFCRWIEELVRRGVVTGCGGGNYCPTAPVTREQMAVFIAATFGLLLYGP